MSFRRKIHGGNKFQSGGELDVDANVRPETSQLRTLFGLISKHLLVNTRYMFTITRSTRSDAQRPNQIRVVVNAGSDLKHYEANYHLETRLCWSVNSTLKRLRASTEEEIEVL